MSRKQGPPESGRGAPNLFGDLTSKAAESGRRPRASWLGSHPQLEVGAPAPPRRPPRLAGMRPAVIAACRRHSSGHPGDYRAEAEA